MENGLAGETVCNDQVIGVIQAHVWYNTLAGPPWARANPNRARLTLCDDVLQPIRLYRDGANSVRDLSQFDLGGQTRKAIRIGDWAGYVTTGVFLHEVSKHWWNTHHEACPSRPFPTAYLRKAGPMLTISSLPPVDARPSDVTG